MFSRRRASTTSIDETSPWSSEANDPDAPSVTWVESAPAPLDDTDDAPDTDDAGRSPRNAWVAACGVAAIALVGLVWLWPSTADDGDTDATIDDANLPATTLGTLPPSDDRDDATQNDSDAADREADPDDAPVDDGDARLPTSPATGSDGSGSTARPSVQSSSQLALPDDLPPFDQPFEVVMSAPDELITLSFPSGTVRTTPIESRNAGAPQVIVAPDSTLALNFQSGMIIDRDGAMIEVDIREFRNGASAIGWGIVDDRTEFTVVAWGETGSPALYAISDDGATRQVGTLATFPAFADESGGQLVNDGGVFRLGPDGSGARVADGSLLAYDNGRALVRQCDDAYVCTLATLDLETGERIEFVTETDDVGLTNFGWSSTPRISRDGTMIVTVAGEPNGDGLKNVIFRADGSSSEIPMQQEGFFEARLAWAPDSSGFFRSAVEFGGQITSDGSGSIEFVTAAGDIIEIPDLAPGIVSMGVRSVDVEVTDVATGQLSDAAPADIGFGIVGVDNGVAVHIDFENGQLSSWATPKVGLRPSLFHADSAVMAVSLDGDTVFRSTIGSVRTQRLGDGAANPEPRFPGPAETLMWRPSLDGVGFELVPLPLYDSSGGAVNTVVVRPEQVLGTDGDGGLVYELGGDVFVTDDTSTRRVTSGELLAIGADLAFARECDDAGLCPNIRIGADGTRTILGGAASLADPPRRWLAPAGTVSPDGGLHLLWFDGESPDDGSVAEPTWAFVDIAETQLLAVPEPDVGAEIIWSADSRYAMFLSDSVIQVFDRQLDSLTPLAEAGEFDAIVAVPLEFAG